MDTKTVRDAVLYAKDNSLGTLREKVGIEFDAWLAEHDRQVAERTLLDAADAVLADHPDPETCKAVFDPWDVDEFLRARIPE